jgi:hypothetical protein
MFRRVSVAADEIDADAMWRPAPAARLPRGISEPARHKDEQQDGDVDAERHGGRLPHFGCKRQ